MKVWKDKDGKELTANEFFTRWKKGIQAVTAFQISKVSVIGYYIVALGLIVGLVTSIVMKQWWLMIILIGSSVITIANFIPVLSKYWRIKAMFSSVEKERLKDE